MRLKNPLGLLLLAFLVAVLAAPTGTRHASSYGAGLIDPGFEVSNLGSSPSAPWQTESASDSVTVVATDTFDIANGNNTGASITVHPHMGDQMLRAGTPRKVAERQASGDNRVSQEFTPASSTLQVAFRLFSWEHRGDDQFSIELNRVSDGTPVGTLVSPIVINLPGGGTTGCSAIPCTFSVDVGKKGDLLDSGWVDIRISGLAAEPVIISYSVAGDANEALATWAYFDSSNLPPVSNFKFTPLAAVLDESGEPTGETEPAAATQRLEGIPVQLLDLSTDPDGSIAAWSWTIDGPGIGTPLTSSAQNPYFIPPQEGVYSVTLTVTDNDGLSTTVSAGGVTIEGDELPPVEVTNAPPLPNAVDLQVQDGSDAAIFARFTDSGWLDTHQAAVLIEGVGAWVIPASDLDETNQPALGNGVINHLIGSDPVYGAQRLADMHALLASPGDSLQAVLIVTDQQFLADGNGNLTPVEYIDASGVELSRIELTGSVYADCVAYFTTNPIPGGDESLPGIPPPTAEEYCTAVHSRADLFTITLVAGDNSAHEPNNTTATAHVLTGDTMTLSYIQSQGDVDVFEVLWKGVEGLGPQQLPPGTEVLASLTDLPADYDIALVTQIPSASSTAPFQVSPFQVSPFQVSPFQVSPFQVSPFQVSPFQVSPFQVSPFQVSPFQVSGLSTAPFQVSPFQVSPFQVSPFQVSPFQVSPFQVSPFQVSPFQVSPFQVSPFQVSPLSTLSFNGLDGTQVSGTDISLIELGLASIGDGEVADVSANRGLEDEAVLAKVDLAGTRVFVVVSGANGSYRINDPYSLRLETSVPLDSLLLNADSSNLTVCEPRIDTGALTTTVEVVHDNPAAETLFVTQRERFNTFSGTDNSNPVWAKLSELAGHPLVNGRIISVPNSIYTGWDDLPCSIDEVNETTDAIRAIIGAELDANPTIQYVVLIGSDDVIPYRRTPDQTTISNERNYLLGSFLKPGSALFSSVLQGFNLTDDMYTDSAPTPWQGRELYIPDLPIARMVETPAEVMASAQAFMDSDGVLDSSQTAFASGYDFFSDGAEAMLDELAADFSGDIRGLISEDWSASDLVAELLCEDPATCTSSASVNAINAHFTHYAGLSAFGSSTGDQSDYFTSQDLADFDGLPSQLFGRIVLTLGCHAGLNVPLSSSMEADAGLGINPALDFAQAMATQRAVFLASTGYGLGDDIGLGGTELLMVKFADEVAGENQTVGQALVQAKRRYISGLSAMTVYDEKSSIQTTLYGLPMYRLPDATGAPVSTLTTSSLSLSVSQTLTINVNDPAGIVPPVSTFSLDEVVTDKGVYYTADGDSQSTAGRAIQPRVVLEDIVTSGVDPVRGVLLTSVQFSDDPYFDPVIARPTTEWENDPPESQTCFRSLWPSELATVKTLDIGQGELFQSLVVVPGQFQCTSAPGQDVSGLERLYTELSLTLLRSSSTDTLPPSVHSVDIDLESGTPTVTVDATDPSGVALIVIIQVHPDGTTTAYQYDNTTGDPGPFSISIPGLTTDDSLIIQVVDGAGNASSGTSKGVNYSVMLLDAPDATTTENVPVDLSATILGFNDAARGPYLYIWELYDHDGSILTVFAGQSTDGTIEESYTFPDDNPTGTPSDVYASKLKVLDAVGGVGTAEVPITVENSAPIVLLDGDVLVENGFATVSGSFTDASPEDTHTATINWGDGTVEPLTVVQGAGSGTFSASHQYLDDDPTGTAGDDYTVIVEVTDDDTGVGQQTAAASVANVAPVITVTGDSIDENGVATVSGTITDPGTLDTFTVTIDWGDGASADYSYPAGSTTFSETHQYLDDNPTNTSVDSYTVTVTVTDDDTGFDIGTATVVVGNVAPVITVTGDSINENGVATVSGTITDPGMLDTFTVTIDWGDGASADYSYPAGSTTFSETHQYLDDNPTNTSVDSYTVTVTVTDDDTGSVSETTVVQVSNVDPVVTAGPDKSVALGYPVTITSAVSDVGTLDTFTASVDWGDGTSSTTSVISGAISATHTYGASGQYVVTVTVADDDLGSGSDTLTVSVGCTGTNAGTTDPDVSIVGCGIASDGVNAYLSITVSGVINENYQYRVYINGTLIKWSNGNVTGSSDATVVIDGSSITFTVSYESLGLSSGDTITIVFETQGGISKGKGEGKPSRYPKTGEITYTLE